MASSSTLTSSSASPPCIIFLLVRKPIGHHAKDSRQGDGSMSGQEGSSSMTGLKNQAVGTAIEKTASVMSPAASHLDPPKDTPISTQELAAHGASQDKPIWLAIRGTVFDVSAKREMYGPGGSYSIFAGKDGSRGLAKSSLKPEDAVPDTTGLEPAEEKTLQQWYDFFSKRYNIVGKVSN